MPVTIKHYSITQVNKPKMYFVYIIYDKYISWEFCMGILVRVFHKDSEKANAIANDIINDGEGLCGVYMLEIADSKATLVEDLAKKEGYSMKCLVEEV